MSFESNLNIAGSHLLEDEEGISTELGDDELEQVSGGPLPIAALWGVRLLIGVAIGAPSAAFGIGVLNGMGTGENEEADGCHRRK